MGNREKRYFYTFPATLMTGWWLSLDKFRERLQRGLDYAILDYTYRIGCTNDTDDELVKKAVHESFALSHWRYDEETHIIRKMRQDKEIYNLYHSNKKQAFFSISVDVFWKFINNPKSDYDCALLIAYSSIKSLLGKRLIMKTNKYAITCRMACFTSLSNNDLPDEVAIYQKRKRYERLKRELFKNYHVGFYTSMGIRGTYVSLKKDKQGEPDLLWLIQEATRMETQQSAKDDPLKAAINQAKQQLHDKGHLRDT